MDIGGRATDIVQAEKDGFDRIEVSRRGGPAHDAQLSVGARMQRQLTGRQNARAIDMILKCSRSVMYDQWLPGGRSRRTFAPEIQAADVGGIEIERKRTAQRRFEAIGPDAIRI